MKSSIRTLTRVFLEQRAPVARWIPATCLGSSGSSGESSSSSSQSVSAAWGAALMAGVVAMDLGRRSDGVAFCEGAERAVSSPMGKTPESKLSKPTFYLNDEYRRHIFFNYERRLRLRSPPEKVDIHYVYSRY